MNKARKPLTREQIGRLATDIYKLLKDNGLWIDTSIYFNGNRIDNRDDDGNYHYDGVMYFHEDMDPRDCFEYVNPDHIISMTFEGPVYHMFNYDRNPSVLKKFNALLKRFGVCYELGDAWNLTCYYI